MWSSQSAGSGAAAVDCEQQQQQHPSASRRTWCSGTEPDSWIRTGTADRVGPLQTGLEPDWTPSRKWGEMFELKLLQGQTCSINISADCLLELMMRRQHSVAALPPLPVWTLLPVHYWRIAVGAVVPSWPCLLRFRLPVCCICVCLRYSVFSGLNFVFAAGSLTHHALCRHFLSSCFLLLLLRVDSLVLDLSWSFFIFPAWNRRDLF